MNNYHNQFRAGLTRYFSPKQLEQLQSFHIGIAGAGGLGSNIAMMLARSGIERMTLIDDDKVEKSNLNRQHYWPRHLDLPKVQALAESLLELNPDMKLDILQIRLDSGNLENILPSCSVWAEALDGAHSKALFVEKALLSSCRVVAASGICGVGGLPMQQKIIKNLVVVGDFKSDAQKLPPMAPRVIQAAAMMADIILEWALKMSEN